MDRSADGRPAGHRRRVKLKASLQPLLQGTTDNLGGSRSVPVECVIHLGGAAFESEHRLRRPRARSDPETQTVVANALSTPETVDTQFAYLLLFNGFMAESSSLASSNIGSSVSAATGMEFLSNMVSSWFSSLGYDFRIGYRPRSEQASDEVDFGISKSLINDRLFVEVEGNYLLDNKQAVNGSMSNFMGEAYITYLIDPAGTLKLKAFTQTIDRFDENQGLQETGIGIYFKGGFRQSARPAAAYPGAFHEQGAPGPATGPAGGARRRTGRCDVSGRRSAARRVRRTESRGGRGFFIRGCRRGGAALRRRPCPPGRNGPGGGACRIPPSRRGGSLAGRRFSGIGGGAAAGGGYGLPGAAAAERGRRTKGCKLNTNSNKFSDLL